MDQRIPTGLQGKFWLVSADMGYGHQRAIFPLKPLARDGVIINANNGPGASIKEIRLWNRMQQIYEFMSRAGTLPVIGRFLAHLLDKMLYIPNFYPLSDRSKPTLQVFFLSYFLNKGLCKSVNDNTKNPELPFITSFYASALAADLEEHEVVYCIITDTDINRVWVAKKPSQSRIIYFAAGTVSAQRLHSYGVTENNILVTGFPLPLELLGDRNLNVLKDNLKKRLFNLDQKNIFHGLYKHSTRAFLGERNFEELQENEKNHCITITFAVGGAGAQKEIGKQIVGSLAKKIASNEVKLNLVAGIRYELYEYFEKLKEDIKGGVDGIKVIWAETNEGYFELFNECLKTTDILWTKPSELTFYCALGIPLILSPAIGPQERCNQKWIREIGAGFKQGNPENTDQWLFDLINKGRIAEAAWNGFLKARKFGTYNIIEFLERGTFTSSNDPLKR